MLLGHCVFHARHSWAHYPYVDDLQLLADSGASVAHAPYKYAKMGVMLESLERYRQLGINVALGTDTFPQDLISEMRLAGLMCRFAEGSFRVGRARDVFDAATLGGARALGRDDLGAAVRRARGRTSCWSICARRTSARCTIRSLAGRVRLGQRHRHGDRRRANADLGPSRGRASTRRTC